MNDFIIRLASMKLAELKFPVEITTHYNGMNNTWTSEEMTLKEIKYMLKNYVISPGQFDFSHDYPEDAYFRFEAYPMSQNASMSHMEVDINIASGMSEKTFRQIIKTINLPVKR